MKKLLLGAVALIFGLFVLLGISQQIAAESGEVVVLTTRDAQGGVHETRLWIVEYDGHGWLRSGGEVQGWYQRLRAAPGVEVLRGDQTASYTAVPVPAERDAINERMRAKYRWADRYIGFLFGRDDVVPIRLDPS